MTQKKVRKDGAAQPAESAVDPVMAELKDLYDSVADEPLPQDLLALLDKLDEAEKSR